MDRRQALRLVALAAAAPVFSRDLFAFGQQVHAQLPAQAKLRVLTPAQDALVATMAELIIPATETPGAKAARVDEFIDLLLAEWLGDADRELFLAGLAETDRRSRASFGQDFVSCEPRQQAAILTQFDQEVARLRETVPAPARTEDEDSPVRHFFFLMKRFTLIGYYTSQIGAEQELEFEILPTTYQGCVSLEATEASGAPPLITIEPAGRR